MAMTYHSWIAASEGFIPVQINGPLWRPEYSICGWYNETYNATESVWKSVPSMEHNLWLYMIVGTQPVMTVLAICVIAFLFRVPISRDLGIISLLAGADQDTLKILKGASYSGKLTKPVPVRIDVSHNVDRAGTKLGSVQYYIGESGTHGRMLGGYIYS
ncbi:hypothetical protein FOZG_04371 [Fusarium oxysporum Fo47]|uniref:Uncharacterized protein n=2 Tax=Fusarium oxysporum Fo47 TaxID=660027 RepID=W9L3M3_FUSOX|nr:hypothetical protein FOZG_04371 [Fusarium oxysporum Fo47]